MAQSLSCGMVQTSLHQYRVGSSVWSMDNEFYKPEQQEQQAPPVEVPPEALSAETLDALIESFILREGTDYGSVEVSLDAKMQQIHRQIKKGDIKITFDPNTETVSLMTARDWKKRLQELPPTVND